MKLLNKTAFITGAGSGIGRATALRFAEEGGKVVCADINKESADHTVRLIEQNGGTAFSCFIDVTDIETIKMAVNESIEKVGKIDVLVNNAGITITGSVEELEEHQWDQEMNINSKSIYLLSKEFWSHFKSNKGGVILNTASIAGQTGIANDAAYCASKSAVIGLTKCMAVDGAPYNIRVNCVCPGFIDTPMIEGFFQDQDDPEGAREFATRIHPLGRLGNPKDIANGFLYLASDDASWVTGTALTIDGGLTCALPTS